MPAHLITNKPLNKKMNKRITLVIMILAWTSATVFAQENKRQVLAEELLTTMDMQNSIEQSFAKVKQMLPQQMKNMQQAMGTTNVPESVSAQSAKIFDMVAAELSWNKMKADYIALYAETLSEQELRDLIAFYKTPTGQSFVKKQPELMQRAMEINQKLMIKLMPRIQAITQESLMPAATK